MRFSALLSASRHGVWYFRCPIPAKLHPRQCRSDLKVSLGTRDPGEALRLARWFGQIAEAVIERGTLFGRGDYQTAVFQAFKEVEVAVRIAGGFDDRAIGTELMRAAFHAETGPLTDTSLPKAEREALAHLFAGAIGSYKNPTSHRTVTISDATEAGEMLILASHLLRIVDDRAKRLRSSP